MTPFVIALAASMESYICSSSEDAGRRGREFLHASLRGQSLSLSGHR
jgi:hypothetical protein